MIELSTFVHQNYHFCTFYLTQMPKLSFFTRFSWGKILLKDFAPCKKIDISQLCLLTLIILLAHVMVLAVVMVLACIMVSPRVIVLSVIVSAVSPCYSVSPCFDVGQHDGVIC